MRELTIKEVAALNLVRQPMSKHKALGQVVDNILSGVIVVTFEDVFNYPDTESFLEYIANRLSDVYLTSVQYDIIGYRNTHSEEAPYGVYLQVSGITEF